MKAIGEESLLLFSAHTVGSVSQVNWRIYMRVELKHRRCDEIL